MLYSGDGMACSVFFAAGVAAVILELLSDADNSELLFIEPDADIEAAFVKFTADKGEKPKIVGVRGLGLFALAATRKAALDAQDKFIDDTVATDASNPDNADASGPVNSDASCPAATDISGPVAADEASCLVTANTPNPVNAEIPAPAATAGRLGGRIALVTGAAQGFGRGIAEAMAAEGAYIAVADMNIEGAAACAAQINALYGTDRAIAIAVDVTDESSVERMVQETVLRFGGLDALVSNAGVLTAGGLDELTKESFEFVTKVNYTGYFLCSKYAAEPMKIQNRVSPGYMTDIIEINSKSGLAGSNKNFAYAGSKFGGIGLTQSFALELVEYGIKVNAICPGNLLDGPLWSDPERGLFRQYLDQGKVEGAKTIEDVREFYEAKVPMKRGCTVIDVARAIFYVIEQKYETGQAIPVTGGQVMLH